MRYPYEVNLVGDARATLRRQLVRPTHHPARLAVRHPRHHGLRRPVRPHATWERMESTAEAILEGDPQSTDMVRQGFKAKVQEFMPGVGKRGH
ncbi:hypothetical protein [Streptomyces sp. NPDC102360]|uniref:hypothetical protein n=1 Tax=Streptomyces sp. NPDC102360 TaxID=3366160 RepID=UPI0037FBE210